MDATLNPILLSDMLRDARVAKGLELADIAEITHIRKDYLQALEEGRYGDLPEDIYAKNFLRLYAQTVGLDDAKLLERFSRERRAALGISTVSDAVPSVSNSYREVTPKRRNPAAVWLPVLVLVALGGLGYFVFNRYLLPTTATNAGESQVTAGNSATQETPDQGATLAENVDTSAQVVPATPETNEAIATTDTATPTDAATTTTPSDLAGSVRFSLVTTPPGAEATLDNYPFPDRTPFFEAPVTPRNARVLRITLEGYQPYEELLDITADLSKAITLTLEGQVPAATPDATPPATTAQGQATGQGQLGIIIEAQTWLEVYQSTVRGEGERLIYTTVSPGQTFTFNLPVYVHVGNAAGVRLTQDGQDAGLMGSSGEVTGRSFGQPLPPAPAPAPTPTPETTDPAVEGPQ